MWPRNRFDSGPLWPLAQPRHDIDETEIPYTPGGDDCRA